MHDIDTQKGPVKSFSSPDRSFEFTLSFSSIEHFGNEQDAKASIFEQARILKSGVVAIIDTEVFLTGPVNCCPDDVFTPVGSMRSLVEQAAAHKLNLIEDTCLMPQRACS